MIFIQIAILLLAACFYAENIRWGLSFVFLGAFVVYIMFVMYGDRKPLARQEALLSTIGNSTPENPDDEEPIASVPSSLEIVEKRSGVYKKRSLPPYAPKRFKQEIMRYLYWSTTDGKQIIQPMYEFIFHASNLGLWSMTKILQAQLPKSGIMQ